MLIIDRGAVIRFSPAAGLIVNGNLEVNGEAQTPVTFTIDGRKLEANKWDGIKITGLNAKTTVHFVKIENAKYGLSFKNAGGEVEHCLIQKCDYAIFAAHESRVSVGRSTFTGNNANIHIEGLSNAQINGNILSGDNKAKSKDTGIYANNSITQVENNICTNLDNGIKIEYNGDVKIKRNLCEGNEYDVYIYSAGKVQLEKNTFNGTKQLNFYLGSYSTLTFVRNNFFKSINNIAVLLQGRAIGDIDAVSNYWETTNLEEARRRIKDERVDSNNRPTNFKVNLEPIALQEFADAYPE